MVRVTLRDTPMNQLERDILQMRCAIRRGRPDKDDVTRARDLGSIFFYSRRTHITVYADDMQYAMITAKRGRI